MSDVKEFKRRVLVSKEYRRELRNIGFWWITKCLTNLSELGRLGYNEANFLLIVIHQWAPLAVTRFSEN